MESSCSAHSIVRYSVYGVPHAVCGSYKAELNIYNLDLVARVGRITEGLPLGWKATVVVEREDEPLLLCESTDHQLGVWSISTRRRIAVVKGHTAHITAIRVFDRGGMLYAVTSSADTQVRVWDLSARCPVPVAILSGHSHSVEDLLLFNSSGVPHAVSRSDCALRVWNLKTARCAYVLEGYQVTDWSLFELKGVTWVVAGTLCGQRVVWNPISSECAVRPIEEPGEFIHQLTVCHLFGGPVSIEAIVPQGIVLWDLLRHRRLCTFDESQQIVALDFLQSRKHYYVVAATAERKIHLWRVGDRQLTVLPVSALALLPWDKDRARGLLIASSQGLQHRTLFPSPQLLRRGQPLRFNRDVYRLVLATAIEDTDPWKSLERTGRFALVCKKFAQIVEETLRPAVMRRLIPGIEHPIQAHLETTEVGLWQNLVKSGMLNYQWRAARGATYRRAVEMIPRRVVMNDPQHPIDELGDFFAPMVGVGGGLLGAGLTLTSEAGKAAIVSGGMGVGTGIGTLLCYPVIGALACFGIWRGCRYGCDRADQALELETLKSPETVVEEGRYPYFNFKPRRATLQTLLTLDMRRLVESGSFESRRDSIVARILVFCSRQSEGDFAPLWDAYRKA